MGVKAEEAFKTTGDLPDPSRTDNKKSQMFLAFIRDVLKTQCNRYHMIKESPVRVSNRVIQAVESLYLLIKAQAAWASDDNEESTFAENKDPDLYSFYHRLPDVLLKATDRNIFGKMAVVCGYGDVGKSYALALMQAGAHVAVYENNCIHLDPMGSFPTHDDVFSVADIFVITNGDINVNHMVRMKNDAILCYAGIDMSKLETYPGVKRIPIEPNISKWVFSDINRSVMILRTEERASLDMSTWAMLVFFLLNLVAASMVAVKFV